MDQQQVKDSTNLPTCYFSLAIFNGRYLVRSDTDFSRHKVGNILQQINFPIRVDPTAVYTEYRHGLRSRIRRCCRRSEGRFRRRRCPNRRLSRLQRRGDSRERPQYASAERECYSPCRPFLHSRLNASSDGLLSLKGRNFNAGKYWKASSFSV